MLRKWTCSILSISLGVFCITIFLYMMWLLYRVFISDQFVIPTDSMQPTLKPNNKVIVDKTIMGARIYSNFHFVPEGNDLQSCRTKGIMKPKHNDIVVFNYPHHNGKINFVINNVYCKRIIALPGDSIWTENGYYRNNNYSKSLGVETEQEKLSMTPDSIIHHEVMQILPYDEAHITSTIKNMHPVYIPRKGDIIKITPYEASYYKLLLEWETESEITWNWDEDKVYSNGKEYLRHEFQHNYYFMAGDNVLDSNDSRYWGLVPEEYIVGVVGYIKHKE